MDLDACRLFSSKVTAILLPASFGLHVLHADLAGVRTNENLVQIDRGPHFLLLLLLLLHLGGSGGQQGLKLGGIVGFENLFHVAEALQADFGIHQALLKALVLGLELGI